MLYRDFLALIAADELDAKVCDAFCVEVHRAASGTFRDRFVDDDLGGFEAQSAGLPSIRTAW